MQFSVDVLVHCLVDEKCVLAKGLFHCLREHINQDNI